MTHHQDVGGMAPGSVNVEAVDIHAEGLRLPLVQLAQSGIVNEALMDVMLANSRTPRALHGDLEAQIASCRTGEKRFAAIYDKFDADTVSESIEALLNYAETLTRREIAQIEDGRYEFEDWLDDDGISPEAQPVRIALTIEVSGDTIHFDFSGSAPQVRSAINNVTSSTLAVIYYAVRTLTGDNIPNNEGAYRPITYHLPEGTIVNSSYPAPVAARGIAIKRIEDVVLGALAKALPIHYDSYIWPR
jgi:N-methylhydantoinase B